MNFHIPNNTIIFISGASGVGKTTIARNILNYIPEILIVQEVDIVREVIRSYSENIKENLLHCLNGSLFVTNEVLDDIFNFDIIMKSTSELSIKEIEKQSALLVKPIKTICERLRKKSIPAIIEGTNISFEKILTDKCEQGYFLHSDNMFFINLYCSEETIHKKHLDIRSKSRNESAFTNKKFENVRKSNDYFFERTEMCITYFNAYRTENIEKCAKPIFNIDTASANSSNEIAKEIVKLIFDNFEDVKQ